MLQILAIISVILICFQPHKAVSLEKTQEQLYQEYENEVSVAYREYQEEKSKELIAKAESLEGKWQGQCVIGVRKFLEVDRDVIQGAAKNLKVDSQEPQLGAIIKMNKSRNGHVGVVVAIEDTRIYVYHSNYGNRERAILTWFDKNDKSILGYKTNF